MAFKITFKKSVAKDLKRIDKAMAVEILDKIKADIGEHADQFPALTGKFAGLRKYRIGDYRVIFLIIGGDTVLILRIAHRKDVYRP